MTEDEVFPTALSDVYHALSASRRCTVIQSLSHCDEEPIAIRELARDIAALEQDIPRERATGKPYRNAYNALSQSHLPVLADTGIIIYDSDRQTVAQGPNFEVAALVIVLNQVTYHTLRGDSVPDPENLEPSMTD